MAAPAQTFWEGLRRGHRTHVSLSQGRAVVTSNHHLSPCSPTSPWGKSKRCHLRLMRTINPCPAGWRSSRQVSMENLGYFCETPQCLHWVTPWIAAGRGKWGFIRAAHMVSPCSIGRGEVEEVTSTHHPPSLSPASSSRLQAAPVSQSPCWGRAGLWLRVVIMEGFKLWQNDENGKGGTGNGKEEQGRLPRRCVVLHFTLTHAWLLWERSVLRKFNSSFSPSGLWRLVWVFF